MLLKLRGVGSPIHTHYCEADAQHVTNYVGLVDPNHVAFRSVTNIDIFPMRREVLNNQTQLVEIININRPFYYVQGNIIVYLDQQQWQFAIEPNISHFAIGGFPFQPIGQIDWVYMCLIDPSTRRFIPAWDIQETTQEEINELGLQLLHW